MRKDLVNKLVEIESTLRLFAFYRINPDMGRLAAGAQVWSELTRRHQKAAVREPDRRRAE